MRDPASWVVPLAVATALALAAILVLGLRRDRLSIGGVQASRFFLLVQLAIVAVVAARA